LAATQWALCLDADFIPTVESFTAVQNAVKAHGFDADGKQLKRAFVLPPFSVEIKFDSPFNFSTISANLGDGPSHAVNPYPTWDNHWKNRDYQCHANIDVLRWLIMSHKAADNAMESLPELYKVPRCV
jgi:hypothetical protein